jgi:hypothetical protein
MRTIALLTLFGITLSGLVACSSNKAGNAANNAAQTAASAAGAMGNAAQGAAKNAGSAMGNAANGAMAEKPNCGAVQAVWVNLNTKVYHEPGDPVYGKTKHGEYLCPSQAQAQGFRPVGGAMKHHRKGSSSTM